MDMPSAEQFQHILDGLNARITMLEGIITQQNTAAALHRPKRSIKDPENLTGQGNWDVWQPLARAILRVDAEAIGTKGAQFYWLYSNLSQKIQAIVLPQLAIAAEKDEYDTADIFNQLSRVYGNPTKQNTSAGKLHSIKQGSQSVAIYLSNFE